MRGYIAALSSKRKLPLGFKKKSPGTTLLKKCGRVQRSASKNDGGLGNVNSAERLREQILFSSSKLTCVGGKQLNRK